MCLSHRQPGHNWVDGQIPGFVASQRSRPLRRSAAPRERRYLRQSCEASGSVGRVPMHRRGRIDSGTPCTPNKSASPSRDIRISDELYKAFNETHLPCRRVTGDNVPVRSLGVSRRRRDATPGVPQGPALGPVMFPCSTLTKGRGPRTTDSYCAIKPCYLSLLLYYNPPVRSSSPSTRILRTNVLRR
ncbi:hypothetical protein J6590_011968 [Homalodisca vitripennis]|nr:hypothetical protein J6590_011968 [Homalodisca vitripennis]